MRKTGRAIAAVLLGALMMPSVAYAEGGQTVLGTVNGWRLIRNAQFCFLQRGSPGSRAALVMLPLNDGLPAFFILLDPAYATPPGTHKEIKLVFNGNKAVMSDAQAVNLAGTPGMQFPIPRDVLLNAGRSQIDFYEDSRLVFGWEFNHDDESFYELSNCAKDKGLPF